MTNPKPSGPKLPRRPLTPAEARTVRNWLATVVALILFTAMLPPGGDPRIDQAATIVVIAFLAMGAITVRRPIGLRIMLGVFAAIAFAYLCTSLTDNLSS